MADPIAERRTYKNFVWNSERWDGFELRDGDIIVSTGPKCGTTWMQMQVALLLFRTPDLPAPLSRISPWLEMNTRPIDEVRADLEAQTHRRFIKTHTPLDGIPWHDGVTYLHVGRDPRDAAVSWDNHMANMDLPTMFQMRADAVGLDDLAELGIDGAPPQPSPDPVERFWGWMEGTAATTGPTGLRGVLENSQASWGAREEPNVHLFHYSDLRADLPGQMAVLADVLAVEPPTDELVDAARFERMKARADHLVPSADRSFWQSNERFFDKARAGDWRDLIGEEGVPRYDAAVRAVIDDDELIAWLHGGWLG